MKPAPTASRLIPRPIMVILACLPLFAAVGCGQSEESLDAFAKRWHAAASERDGQAIFALLDSGSQNTLRHDLEVMRGLEPTAQRAVMDQLGGVRVDSLTELQPSEYFAVLWHRVTDGQRPTMQIEAQDEHSAYMVLTLGEAQQRVRLFREAGRWVWQLPKTDFGPPEGVDDAAED